MHIGTRPYCKQLCANPLIPVLKCTRSSPGHLKCPRGRSKALRRAPVRKQLSHRHLRPPHPSRLRARCLHHFVTGRFSARNSTKADAPPREHHVRRVYTSAQRYPGVADHVECHSMEHTTAATLLDGTPMMRRRRHLEKQITAVITSQKAIVRR